MSKQCEPIAEMTIVQIIEQKTFSHLTCNDKSAVSYPKSLGNNTPTKDAHL